MTDEELLAVDKVRESMAVLREAVARANDERKSLRFALLQCAEFFRDELRHHTFDLMAPKAAERITAEVKHLCDLCYSVLGNPTVAEAEAIRSAVRPKDKGQER